MIICGGDLGWGSELYPVEFTSSTDQVQIKQDLVSIRTYSSPCLTDAFNKTSPKDYRCDKRIRPLYIEFCQSVGFVNPLDFVRFCQSIGFCQSVGFCWILLISESFGFCWSLDLVNWLDIVDLLDALNFKSDLWLTDWLTVVGYS